MSSEFQVNDEVRIQLSKDKESFRYWFNTSDATWYDYNAGDAGPWWDATVEWIDEDSKKMSLLFDVDQDTHCFHLPLAGHPSWHVDLPNLPGWP